MDSWTWLLRFWMSRLSIRPGHYSKPHRCFQSKPRFIRSWFVQKILGNHIEIQRRNGGVVPRIFRHLNACDFTTPWVKEASRVRLAWSSWHAIPRFFVETHQWMRGTLNLTKSGTRYNQWPRIGWGMGRWRLDLKDLQHVYHPWHGSWFYEPYSADHYLGSHHA